MKAVVYEGPRAVSVKDVPEARIERPTDVLVKITTTNNLTTPDDPRMAGAAYGFADIGPLRRQAGRTAALPYGDHNSPVVPEEAGGRQTDYVMLSDIFPTGRHVTELACVRPGDTVVLYGAGPVGCVAALSATLKSAGKVLISDLHPDRLSLVEQIGAIPIHDSKGPIDQVKHTNGLGADRGCACVGYQAHEPQGNEHPDMTLNHLVQPVKFTGTTGVVGVFIPRGPRRPGPMYREGEAAFAHGMLGFRVQNIGNGQTSVKAYNEQLYGLIRAGKAEPSWIVSHELVVNKAADGYTDTSTSMPATTAGRRSSSPGGQLSLTARRHALGAPSPALPSRSRKGTRTGPAGCPRRSHRTTSDS
ncbi:hypothetical protein GCM10009680_61660 [Streptomyces yatensis]|uniref:Alcohol dehydrogenase-like C-terminal domain-containing protein n=1 Tax=Streptomyces yatensis TaxID=155177 RepID=A0ABN2IUW8_9ACTN